MDEEKQMADHNWCPSYSEGEPRKMMVVAIVLCDFVETHTTVKGGGF